MEFCRFCGEYKKLCKAHIVPWSFYKKLIPEGEKYEPFLLITKDFEQKRSAGSFDTHILCAECDNLIGDLDKYGYESINNEKLLLRPNLSEITNTSYKKLGLFLASVFWRASISNHKEFDRVSLGPFEEKIKNQLLKWKEGAHFDFSEFVIAKYSDKEIPKDLYERNIMLPYSYKMKSAGSVNVSSLYLPGGFKIIMKFDNRVFTGAINDLINASKKDDKVFLLLVDNFRDSNEFKAILDLVK